MNMPQALFVVLPVHLPASRWIDTPTFLFAQDVVSDHQSFAQPGLLFPRRCLLRALLYDVTPGYQHSSSHVNVYYADKQAQEQWEFII